MAPKPIWQNPQTQRLTSALRKICQDYPAGAGVFRELLQNADDAGASVIEFRLDSRWHSAKPVVAEGLEEFQGPALLAYNDARFSDTDWKSIASIGDSEKLRNKLSTGKFGLGFNSVYNWTDSPSILSDSKLCLLDPHHSWSSAFSPPGGPMYDFVADADDEAMINQLDGFSLINIEWTQPFNGTIIRLPLRSASHASRSKIKSVETTEADIRQSMDSFAQEMGKSGILFLKSVRRIRLTVNDEPETLIELTSLADLTSPSTYFSAMFNQQGDFESQKSKSFYGEVTIRHVACNRETRKQYGLFHLFGWADVPNDLLSWALSEKLLPWVAVASRLDGTDSADDVGRLFTVLPLPIMTGLKVHINSLFSISADRSRLRGLDDSGAHDKRPERWNKFLFDSMIPFAWVSLFSHISTYHPEGQFRFWEDVEPSKMRYWTAINERLIEHACQADLSLWPTKSGFASGKEVLFVRNETCPLLTQAIDDLGIPSVLLPDHVMSLIEKNARSSLTPKNLNKFVLKISSVPNLSESSSSALLEYLFESISLEELSRYPIFPFRDKSRKVLVQGQCFLHRVGSPEDWIFRYDCLKTMDAGRLTPQIASAMHSKIDANSNYLIQHRNLASLRDYFQMYISREDTDVIDHNDKISQILPSVWKWIFQRNDDLRLLGELHLIPLRNDRYRKLVPSQQLTVTCFTPGQTWEVALSIVSGDQRFAPETVITTDLHEAVVHWLISLNQPCICMKDGNAMAGFADFLKAAVPIFKESSLEVMKSLWNCLHVMVRRGEFESNVSLLKQIPCFIPISWPRGRDGNQIRELSSLPAGATCYGLQVLVPVPSQHKTIYFDATDEDHMILLKDCRDVKLLSEVDIVRRLVLPAMKHGSYESISPEIQLQAYEHLLHNFSKLSKEDQKTVSTLKFVPKAKAKATNEVLFAAPKDLINPEATALKALFFVDETAWPDEDFWTRNEGVLKQCGLICQLNRSLATERIKAYQNRKITFDILMSKVKQLLETPLPGTHEKPGGMYEIAHKFPWLPARYGGNEGVKVTPDQCRDRSDEDVVAYVLPVVPIRAQRSWKSLLGWDSPISANILRTQTEKCIEYKDNDSLSLTLAYFSKHYGVIECQKSIGDLGFVLSNDGNLIHSARAVRRGAEKLSPYLYNVDNSFYGKHEGLMKSCAVPETPSYNQLKAILSSFGSKPLSEFELDVAVEIAECWDTRDWPTEELRVPDSEKKLHETKELVIDDVIQITDVQRPIVNNKISRELASRLLIEPLSELVRRGKLCIPDDEDEFEQIEDTTTRIRDSLQRYTIQSTFAEYLANADDCGAATTLNILVDENSYAAESLITNEFGKFQGPALLMHNDGVFTDKDFEGFKHVGRGSKRDNPNTIGKFGRGSQTMFHWTDVPIIISGPYFLVLDPLRKHLFYNSRTGQRKPGLKIPITAMKSNYPDHLAPFEGLWGFDSTKHEYEGTIFRFPLRNLGESSDLLELKQQHLDLTLAKQQCDDYFRDARLSLLFLRQIQQIDYSIKPLGVEEGIKAQIQWSVRREKWPSSWSTSDEIAFSICNRSLKGDLTPFVDRYWRVMEDPEGLDSDELANYQKTRMKYVECGIAAPIGQRDPCSKKLDGSRFFNCMPLKFSSSLPVHIHGTLLLSGDRRNIVIEETAKDEGSEWNRRLLEEKIPHLYLYFLEEIGRKFGTEVYEYFPAKDPGDALSRLIVDRFWKELPSTDLKIFPAVQPQPPAAKPNTPNRIARRLPILHNPSSSVFDFLDRWTSEALEALLIGCRTPLVRPPANFRIKLKSPETPLKRVTPALVCKLVRSEQGQAQMTTTRSDDKAFKKMVEFLTPGDKASEADFTQLHGCKILPLADGSLGMLLTKWSESNQVFFVAPSEILGLFEFARQRFVEAQMTQFVTKITNSELFNVVRFKKSDIATLLAYNSSWELNEISYPWITDIWKYLNSSSETEQDLFDLNTIQDFPLIVVKKGANTKLESLSAFNSGPGVVEPDIDEHKALVGCIPGLGVVAPDTLPRSYLEEEANLMSEKSMVRLMRSIEFLASEKGVSITEFIRPHLPKKQVKTLRPLLAYFTYRTKASSYLLGIFQQLPVCTSEDPDSPYLAPFEAWSVKNSDFLVPWMKDYKLFVKDSSLIPESRILSPSNVLEHYVLPVLPASVDGDIRKSYVKLLGAIFEDNSLQIRRKKSTSFTLPLDFHRLAAGADGILRLPCLVFNPEDELFSCAFRRLRSSKLLMKECQLYIQFFKKLGMRHCQNGNIKASDYVECLEALQGDFESEPLSALQQSDIRTCLQPLCSGNSIIKWDQQLHTQVAELAKFPIQDLAKSHPKYRQGQMTQMASRGGFIPMTQVIRKEHLAVCWSQRPFVDPQPSTNILQLCIPGYCGPGSQEVWNHLIFLSQIARNVGQNEVAAFVKDLEQTYAYLQKLRQSALPTELRSKAIWLNAESLDSSSVTVNELNECWTTIDKLILDSPCDALPLRTVRTWLLQFSGLLKAVGCRPLIYPKYEVQQVNGSLSVLPIVRQFRGDRVLTDVVIRVENREISAHKVILAAQSLFCKGKFHTWGPEGGNTLEVVDHTFETTKVLVDFCYDDYQDWLSSTCVEGDKEPLDTLADKLDNLLDVLYAADMWLMENLHILVEHQFMAAVKYFVRPDNVLDVLEKAKEANGKGIVAYCEQYHANNREAIEQANN